MHKVTVHTYSNGTGLVVFDGDVEPDLIKRFKQAWKSAVDEGKPPTFYLAGFDVETEDHPNPWAGFDIDFDTLSHAFGGLGWEVEDEEIEALLDQIQTYRREKDGG